MASRFHPVRRGAYVRAELTTLDALQIFSVALLRHVLLELDWKGSAPLPTQGSAPHPPLLAGPRATPRACLWLRRAAERFHTIDTVVQQQQVTGAPRGEYVEWRNTSLQAVYVPLRELLRKFDGYGIGKLSASPPLLLPPQANARPRGKPRLLAAMLCRSDPCVKAVQQKEPSEGGWRPSGVSAAFAWRRTMLALYAGPPTPDGAVCVPTRPHNSSGVRARPHNSSGEGVK